MSGICNKAHHPFRWSSRAKPQFRRSEGSPNPQLDVHSSQTNPSQSYTTKLMSSGRRFYIYIMTNGPKAAILYVGITGDLRRRVWQHKNKPVSGFTGRYNLTR